MPYTQYVEANALLHFQQQEDGQALALLNDMTEQELLQIAQAAVRLAQAARNIRIGKFGS